MQINSVFFVYFNYLSLSLKASMAFLTVSMASCIVPLIRPPEAFRCPPPLKNCSAIRLQGKSSTERRLTQMMLGLSL